MYGVVRVRVRARVQYGIRRVYVYALSYVCARTTLLIMCARMYVLAGWLVRWFISIYVYAVHQICNRL